MLLRQNRRWGVSWWRFFSDWLGCTGGRQMLTLLDHLQHFEKNAFHGHGTARECGHIPGSGASLADEVVLVLVGRFVIGRRGLEAGHREQIHSASDAIAQSNINEYAGRVILHKQTIFSAVICVVPTNSYDFYVWIICNKPIVCRQQEL